MEEGKCEEVETSRKVYSGQKDSKGLNHIMENILFVNGQEWNSVIMPFKILVPMKWFFCVPLKDILPYPLVALFGSYQFTR